MYLLEIYMIASPKYGQKERIGCMDEAEMEVAMVSL